MEHLTKKIPTSHTISKLWQEHASFLNSIYYNVEPQRLMQKEVFQMKMNRRKILVFTICLAIVIVGIILFFPVVQKISNSELVNLFRSFSVVIDNQSNHDITSVETGIITSSKTGEIIEGQSIYLFEKTIKSGETVRITPKLSLSGKEGSIYVKIVDTTGNTTTKGVCGYTEYLSGNSKVTINDNGLRVEENCY